jgi:hypothetical protein
LDQKPGVSSLDIYQPSWEYLKDSQKFLSINQAMLASGKQTMEVTPSALTNGKQKRPTGTKASKRRQEEEKIVEHVKELLKETVNVSTNNHSSSALLATAFNQFAAVLSTGLQQWQERSSYINANPEIKRKYNNLVLMECIKAMESQKNITTTPTIQTAIDKESNATASTPHLTILSTVAVNNNNNITTTTLHSTIPSTVNLTNNNIHMNNNSRRRYAKLTRMQRAAQMQHNHPKESQVIVYNHPKESQVIVYGEQNEDSLEF